MSLLIFYLMTRHNIITNSDILAPLKKPKKKKRHFSQVKNVVVNNGLLEATYCIINDDKLLCILRLSMMTFIIISNNINVVTSSNVSTTNINVEAKNIFFTKYMQWQLAATNVFANTNSANIQGISDKFLSSLKSKDQISGNFVSAFSQCSTMRMSQSYLYAGLLEFAKFSGIKAECG